jgi:hypothetical protein
MIGEDEASSYNAMSVCECTFEYSGVGVQSNAYIWVQRYCIAAVPLQLEVVWQLWVTVRFDEIVYASIDSVVGLRLGRVAGNEMDMVQACP